MSAPEATTAADAMPPRRLDPRTILIQTLKSSLSIILGLPVLLAWSRGEGFSIAALLLVAAVLAGVALAAGWLRWRFFTYQILPGQVVIARGLIKRTRRSIPVERIQDVSISQNLLSRIFGLAEVRIETGGGEADEGRLDSVSLGEAHRLREVLRSLRVAGPAPEARSLEDPAEAEDVVFRMGLPRLLYSGLFNFSLVWIAAIAGLLQYLGQSLGYDSDRWLEMFGVAERALQSSLNVTVVLGLGGIALGLGLLAGVAGTVLLNYGFTLTHAGARFRYTRGLLTRTDVVVAKRQIQLGLVERGAVSGHLGWAALRIQTMGGADHASGRQELAPFARPEERAAIIALAGLPPFERSGLRRVSPWHVLGGLTGLVMLLIAILLMAMRLSPLAAWLVVVMPVPLAIVLLQSRFHRYGLAETSVQVMRGALRQREWTVPYGNVQAVSVRRGPLQRRLGLATVRIDTAGGRGLGGPHVHDIAEADAEAFVGELIARVEARDAGPRLG